MERKYQNIQKLCKIKNLFFNYYYFLITKVSDLTYNTWQKKNISNSDIKKIILEYIKILLYYYIIK